MNNAENMPLISAEFSSGLRADVSGDRIHPRREFGITKVGVDVLERLLA